MGKRTIGIAITKAFVLVQKQLFQKKKHFFLYGAVCFIKFIAKGSEKQLM